MDVGVRELKKHLSAYLDRAAQGETIRVTDRGRPKALLGPVPMAGRILQAEREGWLKRGDGTPPPVRRRTFRARADLQRVLDQDRGT
jgi:prevent-host-death family protein